MIYDGKDLREKDFLFNDFIIYQIPKNDIVNRNTKTIFKLIDLCEKNFHISENKLVILIDGYNLDSKEVYEIEEVRDFVNLIFNYNSLFLRYITNEKDIKKIFFACLCDINVVKSKTTNKVFVEVKPNKEMYEKLLVDLPDYISKYDLTDKEINNILESYNIQ